MPLPFFSTWDHRTEETDRKRFYKKVISMIIAYIRNVRFRPYETAGYKRTC